MPTQNAEPDLKRMLMLPTEAVSLKRLERALAAGADPNRCRRAGESSRESGSGWTPLMSAIRKNKLECVKRLLEAGADPNLADRNGHYAPVAYACELGQEEALRALLSAGANPNATNAASESALSVAAQRDAPGCVRALLEAGADPNQENAHREGPLLRAILAESRACAYELARAGADLDRGLFGLTPRSLASRDPVLAGALSQGLADREAAELEAIANAAESVKKAMRM